MAASTWMIKPPRDVPMKAPCSMPSAVRPGDDVAGLDDHVVVLPVWIVGGLPAPAIVERHDFSRASGLSRESIRASSWKSRAFRVRSGQADDRQSTAAVLSIDAGMELQPVGRRIEKVGKARRDVHSNSCSATRRHRVTCASTLQQTGIKGQARLADDGRRCCEQLQDQPPEDLPAAHQVGRRCRTGPKAASCRPDSSPSPAAHSCGSPRTGCARSSRPPRRCPCRAGRRSA